jgi:hypothetical protein
MTAKKSGNPVVSTAIPQKGRADKRARFAPEEKKEHRGASPLVLVGGILIVLLLIGGAVIALPRLSPSASAGQVGSAVDTGSAAVLSKPAAAAPSAAQGSAAGQNASPVSPATLGHDPYPLVAAEDGAVRLPLSTFDDYKAHFYTYMVNGRPVEFFVVKSQDGVVRAAFNACDVCFQAKRGYRQEGDVMICNNCGRRFPTDQINEVQGGCNPSPLTRTISGDTIIILDTDLAQGLSFF